MGASLLALAKSIYYKNGLGPGPAKMAGVAFLF